MMKYLKYWLILPVALQLGLVAFFIRPLTAQEKLRIAVVGDYGYGLLQPAADVAALIRGWNPDLVLTLGDNNYPNGTAATIDENIGQHYREFIHPYSGGYGPGDTVNRFFPALGNHDWNTAGALPYLAYFQLPGNERYYDVVRGGVHFFILDSDGKEPDGNGAASAQAVWLQAALAASTAQWKLVLFHHAPWSSGVHGSITVMQWPFAAWGATAVLAGHDHHYERLEVDGIPFFVNGLGGAPFRVINAPIPGSRVRFTGDYGAMRLEADTQKLSFEFITRTDSLVDRYTLYSSNVMRESVSVTPGWNLVSLPLLPVDSSLTALFPTALAGAYRLDTSGYLATHTLSMGAGYWVKLGEGEVVEFAGYPDTRDTAELRPGWNLVAASALPVAVEDIVEDPPGILSSRFFGYREGYFAADTLQPGRAYWVKSAQPGRIVIR